jgi:hypothetical protein
LAQVAEAEAAAEITETEAALAEVKAFEKRKITLMGIHYEPLYNGDPPQKTISPLIVNDVNITDYETIHNLKPQNTLLLYNENLEQFYDKEDLNSGENNGKARKWRIDNEFNPDKLSLGIPTMTSRAATVAQIKEGIDWAFTILRNYILANPKLDLIVWTSDGDLEISTAIATRNLRGNLRDIKKYIRLKMIVLKNEFDFVERYSVCNPDGYKRLFINHLPDSQPKESLRKTLKPESEYQAICEQLQTIDPGLPPSFVEGVFREKEILEEENPTFVCQSGTSSNATLTDKERQLNDALSINDVALVELLLDSHPQPVKNTNFFKLYSSKPDVKGFLEIAPDVLDINSYGDGHCFFRSVYISLVAKKLLVFICQKLGISDANENEFVKSIRSALVHSLLYEQLVPEMLRALVQPQMTVDAAIFCGNMGEIKEYLKIIGVSPETILAQKREIINQFQNVRDITPYQVTGNFERYSYATSIEIECLRIMFETYGIKLDLQPANIKRPDTIVVKRFGEHYHSFVERDKFPLLEANMANFSEVTQGEITALKTRYGLQ